MKRNPRRMILAATLPAILLTACSTPPDERSQQIADDAMRRQQEQNKVISDQTKQATETTKSLLEADKATRQEMAETHRQLVEAESQSREELLALQDKLLERDAAGRAELNQLTASSQEAVHGERQSMDQQREALEQERRAIARDRQRAPLIAAAITQFSLIIACLSPLLLAAYVVFSLRSDGEADDQEMVRVLIQQAVGTDRPLLAPPQDASVARPALSASAESSTDSAGDT